MWFTPQNVEEGKCILEGTETFINIKHQNERLLKRTPSLSTSNEDPWRHVMGEAQTLSRLFLFVTKRPMQQLLQCGSIEPNPVMWLSIWRDHIDNYIHNRIDTEYVCEKSMPKISTKYTYSRMDSDSPAKKRSRDRARKNLNKVLKNVKVSPEKQTCVMDNTQAAQFCLTHNCSAMDCWVFEPMPEEEDDNKLIIDTQHQTTPVSIAYSPTDNVIVLLDSDSEDECAAPKKKKILETLVVEKRMADIERRWPIT